MESVRVYFRQKKNSEKTWIFPAIVTGFTKSKYGTDSVETASKSILFLAKVQRDLWVRVPLDRPSDIITRESALLFVEGRRAQRWEIPEMVSRRYLRRSARNQRNEASRSCGSLDQGTNNRRHSSLPPAWINNFSRTTKSASVLFLFVQKRKKKKNKETRNRFGNEKFRGASLNCSLRL